MARRVASSSAAATIELPASKLNLPGLLLGLLLVLVLTGTRQVTSSSEPFIGEIKMVAFNYAPRNWALCNGQLLPINQNQALFSLLGTTYGGNGLTNFALPDFRGRAPIHMGAGYVLGSKAGQESVTLTQSQMPQHSHPLACANGTAAAHNTCSGKVLGRPTMLNMYGPATSLAAMSANSIGSVGGGWAHQNMPPFIVSDPIIE